GKPRRCGNRPDAPDHRSFLDLPAGAALRAISVAMDVGFGNLRGGVYSDLRSRMVTVGVAGLRGLRDRHTRPFSGEEGVVGQRRYADAADRHPKRRGIRRHRRIRSGWRRPHRLETEGTGSGAYTLRI